MGYHRRIRRARATGCSLWALRLGHVAHALLLSPQQRHHIGPNTGTRPALMSLRGESVVPGPRVPSGRSREHFKPSLGKRTRRRPPPWHLATSASPLSSPEPEATEDRSSRIATTRGGFFAALAAAGFAPVVLTEAISPPSYDVTHERIFDTRRSSFLPAEPEQVLGRGFSNRILCLGELHTHPLHHRMQFRVMKAVHAVTQNRKEPLAIGLEMFYRQQQGPLDRYVFKHGDLRLLKLETKWDQTWGFDFNQYAKIFRYAREHGIRLVGLNAPASLLYLVNKVGVDGLPQQIRDVMPEMDLGQEKHRRRFEDTIHGFEHGMTIDNAQMDRMYEAQTLWDEYMAETASKYIKLAGGRMVLLAGNGHVQGRDGIPDRVERRTKLKPFTVVPVSVDWTANGLPDIEKPPGQSFADWVYFTQREIEPPARGAGSDEK